MTAYLLLEMFVSKRLLIRFEFDSVPFENESFIEHLLLAITIFHKGDEYDVLLCMQS